jgi:hypothetical protein
VWSSRRGARQIEHLGSAHDDAARAVAAERVAAGQQVFDLGLTVAAAGAGPLEIVSSRAGHLWDALCRAYDRLDLD